MNNQLKWHKGYNRTRKQLRAQLEHMEALWHNEMDCQAIYQTFTGFCDLARQLPEDDGAQIYVERANKLVSEVANWEEDDYIRREYWASVR